MFKVAADQAGGSFSIVEHPYQPGVLIPPHVHADASQLTYVIEGEVGIRIGDDVFDAPAGAYLIKPSGVPHTHWNATEHPARVMEITTPGGFETFFDELGTLFADGVRPIPPPSTNSENVTGHASALTGYRADTDLRRQTHGPLNHPAKAARACSGGRPSLCGAPGAAAALPHLWRRRRRRGGAQA